MTDLDGVGASPHPQRPARSATMIALLPAVAVAILLLDLITKIVVVATIDPLRPVSVIGDTVTLRLLRNSGAAFSMATGYTWVLTVVALAVVAGIIRYSSRLRSPWWALGLGLILGGALGNLVDRIFRGPGPLRGHVVDFVSVGWWPVFNVADSAVVCGAVLLVALTLFGVELDGTRVPTRTKNPGANNTGTHNTEANTENTEAQSIQPPPDHVDAEPRATPTRESPNA